MILVINEACLRSSIGSSSCFVNSRLTVRVRPMALRGGLEMVPARSHKPITRVQIPLSQFRCRRSSAGKERLFRKQQAAGSKPAAGFQTYDKRALGLQGVATCLASRKQPGSIPGRSIQIKSYDKKRAVCSSLFVVSDSYSVSGVLFPCLFQRARRHTCSQVFL